MGYIKPEPGKTYTQTGFPWSLFERKKSVRWGVFFSFTSSRKMSTDYNSVKENMTENPSQSTCVLCIAKTKWEIQASPMSPTAFPCIPNLPNHQASWYSTYSSASFTWRQEWSNLRKWHLIEENLTTVYCKHLKQFLWGLSHSLYDISWFNFITMEK